MGQRQPPAELSCCFFWCAAIKRHRRCGASGEPRDLCAPFPQSDAGNLNEVFAAVDDFVEAMHVHSGNRRCQEVGLCERLSLAVPGRQSSERTIEGASTKCSRAVSAVIRTKKNSAVG